MQVLNVLWAKGRWRL